MLVELSKEEDSEMTDVTPGGCGTSARLLASMTVKRRIRKGIDFTSLERGSGDEEQHIVVRIDLTSSQEWPTNWNTISCGMLKLKISFVHRR